MGMVQKDPVDCDRCNKPLDGKGRKGEYVTADGSSTAYLDDWICEECFDGFCELETTEEVVFEDGYPTELLDEEYSDE